MAPRRGWPGEKARERLREVEADPHGHGFLDIRDLLHLWGVTEKPPGGDIMGYELWVHPEAPEDPIYFPQKDELAPASVAGICRALRKLERRLDP